MMANPDFSPDLGGDFNAQAAPAQYSPGGAALSPDLSFARQWTKLGIVNEALTNTANNTVSLPEDVASDEWRVGSSIYDQWLQITLARRTWKFATQIVNIQRKGDSSFPGYGDVFAKPPDCLYLQNCWRADLAALVQPALCGAPSDQYNTMAPPLDYAVIGDEIHTTSGDGPGDFNEDFSADFDIRGPLFCEYVPFPTQDMPFSVGFIAALRLKIEAGIYRALNEDTTLAMWAEKASEAALEEAVSRVDQEEPRRVAFRSRLLERRRSRRGGGW